MRVRRRPRQTALERRQRYLDEMRDPGKGPDHDLSLDKFGSRYAPRVQQSRGLTPRARRLAGNEARDPRFAELDALIRREDAKKRRAGIDPNAITVDEWLKSEAAE